MDPVSPVLEEVAPVSKPKSNVLVWIVGGTIVLSIGIMVGFFLNKRLSQTPKAVPTPTPLPISEISPTPDLTANWKTITFKQVELKIPLSWWYKSNKNQFNPIEWVDINPTQINDPPQSIAIFSLRSDTEQKSLEKKKQEEIDNWHLIDVQEDKLVISGVSVIRIVGKVDPSKNNYNSRFQKGDVVSIVFFSLGGNIYQFLGNVTSNLQDYNQILSTFKFIESSPKPTLKPAKTLKYFLPAGWKTVQDRSGTYEVGYNPTDMQRDESAPQWVNIEKLRGGSLLGYSSYFGVDFLTYDGGSRHQFIFSYMLNTPTKQDYQTGYKEVEYLYNGRSCLFLEGIRVSQIPSTWGMCDAGNNKAFLIIAEARDQELETMMQTVRLLK